MLLVDVACNVFTNNHKKERQSVKVVFLFVFLRYHFGFYE